MARHLVRRMIVVLSIIGLSFVFQSSSVQAGWFSWLDRLLGHYSYNVLIYTPSDKEEFIGTVESISECQVAARNRAKQLSIPVDYLCCKTDGDSFCISKHR